MKLADAQEIFAADRRLAKAHAKASRTFKPAKDTGPVEKSEAERRDRVKEMVSADYAKACQTHQDVLDRLHTAYGMTTTEAVRDLWIK